MNFRLFLVLLSLFIMSSCGDDNSPVINITSPENGASFSPGDIINLNLTVTDDIGVSTIQVTSIGLGINVSDSVPDSPLSVPYTLNITLLAETPVNDYEFVIVAVDTDGNFSEENLTVKVE